MTNIQRPIKFRIWDACATGADRKMHYVDLYWFEENGVREWPWPLGGADISIMQFTGLQDRVGKDIYEGDIIRFPNGLRYEVKHGPWKHVDCPDELYGWHVVAEGWEWALCGDRVVVGNIYENPELLESES